MAVHWKSIGMAFAAMCLITACSDAEVPAIGAEVGAADGVAVSAEASSVAPQREETRDAAPALDEPAPAIVSAEIKEPVPANTPAAETIDIVEGSVSEEETAQIVADVNLGAQDEARRQAAEEEEAIALRKAEADRAEREAALRAEQAAAAQKEAAEQAAADRIAQAEADARAEAEARAQAEAAAAAEAQEAEAAREAEAKAAQEAAAALAAVPVDGLLASGSWIKKKRTSNGTWSIVRENGALFVELDADFRTRNAPDLKLFLSPLSAADVNKNNAVSGSLFISLLDSNRGAQRYAIPEVTSLEGYRSIIIHCQDYTVLWSAADL